jgi:hypothetical protein
MLLVGISVSSVLVRNGSTGDYFATELVVCDFRNISFDPRGQVW